MPGGFGERLERERVARGIKLEEIAEATKISTRLLRALETEDFAKLPGGVFNRAFVRSYARYLGLDEEQLVSQYLAMAGKQEQPLPTVEQPEHNIDAGRWMRFAAVVLLVMVAAAGLWRFRHPLHSLWQHAMSRRPAPIATVSANTPKPAQPRLIETPKPPAESTPAAMPTQAPATSPQPAPTPPAAARPADEANAAPANAAPGQFTLTVTAREDAWLSVKSGEQTLMSGLLKAGSERRFHSSQPLTFLTGNAGGIDLTFNGQPVPSLGASGQAKKLTFTAHGPQQ